MKETAHDITASTGKAGAQLCGCHHGAQSLPATCCSILLFPNPVLGIGFHTEPRISVLVNGWYICQWSWFSVVHIKNIVLVP